MQRNSVKEVARILFEERLIENDPSIKVLYESLPSDYLYFPSRYLKEGVKRVKNLEILEEGRPLVISISYKSYDELPRVDMPDLPSSLHHSSVPSMRPIELIADLNDNKHLLSLSLENLENDENPILYVLTRSYDTPTRIPDELEEKIERIKARLKRETLK